MFHLGLNVTGTLYLKRDLHSEKKKAARGAPSDVALSDCRHLFIIFLAQLDLLKVGNDTA